jgi:hypothetical protein
MTQGVGPELKPQYYKKKKKKKRRRRKVGTKVPETLNSLETWGPVLLPEEGPGLDGAPAQNPSCTTSALLPRCLQVFLLLLIGTLSPNPTINFPLYVFFLFHFLPSI